MQKLEFAKQKQCC